MPFVGELITEEYFHSSGSQHINIKKSLSLKNILGVTSDRPIFAETFTDVKSDMSWIEILSHQDVNDKDLANVMVGVDSFAQKGMFDQLDNLLLVSLKPDVSKIILVSILRVTSKYKDRLASWNHILDNAIIWLGNRGIDPNFALVGLI